MQLVNEASQAVTLYSASFVATVREDKARAIIAIIVIVTACISALLPYQTDSIRWLQGVGLLVIGYYFGLSQAKTKKES